MALKFSYEQLKLERQVLVVMINEHLSNAPSNIDPIWEFKYKNLCKAIKEHDTLLRPYKNRDNDFDRYINKVDKAFRRLWAVSDSGSTIDLQSIRRGSIPRRSTKNVIPNKGLPNNIK